MACPAPLLLFPSHCEWPAGRGPDDTRRRAERDPTPFSSSPVKFPPEAQNESRLRQPHRIQVVDGLNLVGQRAGRADLPPPTVEQGAGGHRRELREITPPSPRQLREGCEHPALLAPG